MSAGRDLLLFILFIIVLGVVWVWTGGPSRSLAHSGWFLNGQLYAVPSIATSTYDTASTTPPQNTGTSTNTGGTTAPASGPSPYAHLVTLTPANASATNPASEFIVLQASSQLQNNLTISGWTLESASGTRVSIGNAVETPVLGQMYASDPIAIGPGSVVVLVSGRSPNGASFRVNECTGYLGQFQSYAPPLQKQCPTPGSELSRYPQLSSDNSCWSFVQNIPQCTLNTTPISGNLSSSCQNFIANALSYNGCVTLHQDDPGFYRDEWRVYFDSNQELWKSHDTIRLLDENGALVAQTVY